ncbi:hypothetical protein NASALF_049 [Candidatus Nasuia deltocephalinicola str. NAS-ALF]|uniref:Uncharacterized protein n=1 Tax=Candidatus Nasuia deltocephalinicola str. NAS-ALF TaxID=1343077 RepID=S5TEV1_9PROT|nr:hypothetical protein NASALF_049 [Candidatus Nasuia deltocephalinicola str. NAS-ALF]
MLIIILKNFFIFNYIYGVLEFNKNYAKNFLIFLNKNFFYFIKNFNIFKKILLLKILKKKKILIFIYFYINKIFLIKKYFYKNFNFFLYLKSINFNSKNIIFIKNINININNYIFVFSYFNYLIKLFFFFF